MRYPTANPTVGSVSVNFWPLDGAWDCTRKRYTPAMAKSSKAPEELPERLKTLFQMSPPWRMAAPNVGSQVAHFDKKVPARGRARPGGPSVDKFVEQRTALHATYIIETERTRRLALLLTAGLLALAVLSAVLVPPERNSLSIGLTCALVVFAAGGAGFSAIRFRFGAAHLDAQVEEHGMTKRPERPRDPNQLAPSIVDIATADEPERAPKPSPKSQLGREHGLKGGKTRSSPEL